MKNSRARVYYKRKGSSGGSTDIVPEPRGGGKQNGTAPLQTSYLLMKTFGLHPYTQNGESVPLGDSQAVTNADNHSASLGINSPECSASKGTTFFSYSKKYKRKQALQNKKNTERMYFIFLIAI